MTSTRSSGKGKQPMSYAQSPARTARAASKAPVHPHAYPHKHPHHHPSSPSPNPSTAQHKQRNSAGNSAQQPQPTSKPSNIWNTSTQEERERIKEFWLNLSEEERRSLVKIEKDTVLRKMKDQQRHSCSCAVCGRKRSVLPILSINYFLLTSG
jgi:hypothetical protein